MAKVVTVDVPHKLGIAKAIHQINDGVPKFEKQFGRVASIEQAHWIGNTLEFNIRSMGLTAPGTIVVMDTVAVVSATLPFPLMPFASEVESLIQKHGAELLAGSLSNERRPTTLSTREEIRRKARAAAEAQGLDWSRLSREQRRSFRQWARG
jgi:hypothetical protein